MTAVLVILIGLVCIDRNMHAQAATNKKPPSPLKRLFTLPFPFQTAFFTLPSLQATSHPSASDDLMLLADAKLRMTPLDTTTSLFFSIQSQKTVDVSPTPITQASVVTPYEPASVSPLSLPAFAKDDSLCAIIEGNYTYCCGACQDKSRSMIFTSFVPKN